MKFLRVNTFVEVYIVKCLFSQKMILFFKVGCTTTFISVNIIPGQLDKILDATLASHFFGLFLEFFFFEDGLEELLLKLGVEVDEGDQFFCLLVRTFSLGLKKSVNFNRSKKYRSGPNAMN